MQPKLIFLGTGAGSGVPSFYCGCRACQEALDEPFYRRTCCSLLIQGQDNLLVDAPPDLRMQLVREKIDRLDALFLTHSHFDHTGGLGELEFYVRLKRRLLPLKRRLHRSKSPVPNCDCLTRLNPPVITR